MGTLIFGMGQVSLDGYVAGRDGNFNWTTPGDDLHRHAGAELARCSTAIYGRRMYELMVFWETADELPGMTPAMSEFAEAWRASDKIVVSGTRADTSGARTRMVRSLDADDVRRLKAASPKPITLSGPTTAAPLLNEGLVDEVTGYFLPIVVGGGLPLFLNIDRPIRLEQVEEVPFDGGFVFRRFAVVR